MTRSSATEREYDEEVQHLVTDFEAQLVAPYPVSARLLALAGTAQVEAATCRTYLDEAAQRRSWEAIWLLPTSLVYVRTSRADANWNAHDDAVDGRTSDGDEVSSWRRQLHTIATISVDEMTTRHDSWRERWAWTAPLRITFLDGVSIKVPALSDRHVMTQAGAGHVDLARALRDRL